MSTLVVYYSYSGNTSKLAAKISAQENAALTEVLDQEKPGKLKAYTVGLFAARKQAIWPIKPFTADLKQYERIIFMAPVWANFPAPAINGVIAMLPPGKKVEFILVSASGKSNCKGKVTALVERAGSEVTAWKDVLIK